MAKKGGTSVPGYERQNTEDYEELPLKIPVASLKEHLLCPICMSRISGCSMTTCGHRFCFKCIQEWVDRRHTCPCCNCILSSKMLIKDTGFDAILKTVHEQWTLAEKEYFQSLVDNVCEGTFKEEPDKNVESPLQVVLQKHLKISLAQHEAFHQHLVSDYHKGMAMISQKKNVLAQEVNREFSHDPNHPDRLAKLASLEDEWSTNKRHLDKEFQKVQKMLANTFDRYLTDHLPPPSTVPLKVKMTVPEKDFNTEVVLKPEDDMDTITKLLRAQMEKQSLVIVEFPKCEEFEIAIISPFAVVEEHGKGAGAEAAEASMTARREPSPPALKDYSDMALTNQVLHPDCRPVMEFRMKTGTEMRFKGKILLDSDVAKMCFANTYNGAQNKTVNYFWCTKCKVKWICEGCAHSCHGEHASSVVSFIKNHKPTRAHCLCPKKSECKLQN